MEPIGRSHEIDEISALFAGGARLVTLTGPGGIGKSALARAALETETSRKYVSFVVDLQEARTEADVTGAVAAAMSVSLAARADPRAQLGDALGARGALWLLLDGCEQAAPAVAACCETWLARAPSLRLLVTSRERLRVDVELAFEVGPLAASDAVRLFLARARAARGELSPGADDEIAGLVSDLDGVPLAIELAAARMAVLGPKALRARLSRSLDVLGGRDAKKTLRATIDASWAQLPPSAQATLARCALFRGGFDVAAAEAVAGRTDASLIDDVQELRDKSLLRGAAHGADVRLSTYESIRAFALEKLAASGDERDAMERHARHFGAVAEELFVAVPTSRSREALARIELEAENLRAVVARALAGLSPLAPATAALEALHRIALRRGPLPPHLAAIEGLCERCDDERLRARLLLLSARARHTLGLTDDAQRDAASARDLARALDDATLDARATWQLGSIAQVRGDLDRAQAEYEAALARVRSIGRPSPVDRETETSALGNLGTVLRERGEPVAARARYEEALAVARAQGHARAEGQLHGDLGALLHMCDELDEALSELDRASELLEREGDERMRALFLGASALVLQERGALEEARARIDDAIAVQRRVGDRRFLAYLVGCRAQVDHEAGALDDAERGYREAVQELRALGNARLEGLFLGGLGALVATRGRTGEAKRAIRRGEELLRDAHDELRLATVRVHGVHLLEDAAEIRARLAEGRDHAALSDDVRFALRLAEPVARDAVSSAFDPQALVIDDERGAFRPPGGSVVDLSRKAAPRRLLAVLSSERLERPGATLSTAALFAAGWPGERAREDSAQNRVYVALTTLRALGLRGILQSGGDGYRLDPAIPLVRAPLQAT